MKRLLLPSVILLVSIINWVCAPEKEQEETLMPSDYFEQFVSNLQPVRLPLRINGYLEKGDQHSGKEADSTFIATFVDPEYYDLLEPQYGYGAPELLAKKERFVAMLIPTSFGVGSEVFLYTFNPNGRVLDTLNVAALSGDIYYRSCKIEENLSIEVRSASLEYDDQIQELVDGFVRKTYYQVKENGQIEPIKMINPDDWKGTWQWSEEDGYTKEGILTFTPVSSDYVEFNLSFRWGESANVREISGKARVEGNGAAYRSGDCKIYFELDKGALIKVRHFNPEQCNGVDGINLSNQYYKQELGPEPQYNRTLANKKLVKDPERSIASCIAYKVTDQKGEEVQLPQNVNALLECPLMVSISPDDRYLIVNDGLAIVLFDFLNYKKTELIVLENNTDGVSDALWSPDKKNLAFVAINQDQYKYGTRLYILQIEEGIVEQTQEQEIKVNRICGSVCSVDAGKDFWFMGNEVIGFRTYNEVPFDIEGEEAVRTTRL